MLMSFMSHGIFLKGILIFKLPCIFFVKKGCKKVTLHFFCNTSLSQDAGM